MREQRASIEAQFAAGGDGDGGTYGLVADKRTVPAIRADDSDAEGEFESWDAAPGTAGAAAAAAPTAAAAAGAVASSSSSTPSASSSASSLPTSGPVSQHAGGSSSGTASPPPTSVRSSMRMRPVGGRTEECMADPKELECVWARTVQVHAIGGGGAGQQSPALVHATVVAVPPGTKARGWLLSVPYYWW